MNRYAYKDTIYLPCKDRACKDSAKNENALVYPQTSFTIKYEEHSYIRFIIPCDKIKENDYSEEDMKQKIYQQAYFENIHNNFPKLNYDDICLNLFEKFPNKCIKYSNNNFKYFKNNEEKLKKLKIDNYNLLSNIKFRNELLEKDYYKYINSETK